MNHRQEFQIPAEVAYLNCAYMAPLHVAVEAAGIEGLQSKRRPYEISPDDFFDGAREVRRLFAQLIDESDDHRVVLMPAVSYGLANAARNLHRTGAVVLASAQFPSNYYIWDTLCREQGRKLHVIQDPGLSRDRRQHWNQALVEAIGPDTAAVSIAHVHWADGLEFDLARIREACDRHDVAMIIDGTQSIGALPFSVKKFRPDAVICAGYKWLLGPYGMAIGWFGERFDSGIPIEENWINRRHSHHFENLVEYESEYGPAASRYSTGQHSNFTFIPMMKQALELVLQCTPEAIQNHGERLWKRLMSEVGEALIDTGEPLAKHLFGLYFRNGLEVLAQQLAAQKIYVSVRGRALRVSPHLYNDEEDIDRLAAALKVHFAARAGAN